MTWLLIICIWSVDPTNYMEMKLHGVPGDDSSYCELVGEGMVLDFAIRFGQGGGKYQCIQE